MEFGGSGAQMLLLIAALFVAECQGSVELLRKGESPVVLTDYAVAKYVALGKQEGSNLVMETVLFTAEDQELFCAEAGLIDLRSRYDNKMVVLLESIVDISCGGALGKYREYRYLEAWCTNVSSTFLRVSTTIEPGAMANEHDGDRFEARKERVPALKDCSFIHMKTNSVFEQVVELFSNHSDPPRTNITIDENKAIRLFKHPLVVIGRVTVSGFLFGFALRAMWLIYIRRRAGKLKPIFLYVLLLSCATGLSLGVVFLGGSHLTTAFWGYDVPFFFYSASFGTSVASNFLLAGLFVTVLMALDPNYRTSLGNKKKKHRFLVTFFYIPTLVLIGVDIEFSWVLCNTVGTNVHAFRQYAPIAMTVVQVGISLFQLKETTLALGGIRSFHEMIAVSGGTGGLPASAVATQQLIRRISYFIRLSIFADTVSVISLILSPRMFIDRTYLVFDSFLLFIARVIALAAQVKACEVASMRNNFWKRSTKSKATTVQPVYTNRSTNSLKER